MGWSLLAVRFSVRDGQTLPCVRAGGRAATGTAGWMCQVGREREGAAVSSARFGSDGLGQSMGMSKAAMLYSPVACPGCRD